ncbi:MAG: hydroxymethylpyrimidine/phosphomethylpyrimidine kinase [Planctomycetes bacterium]|nr:hydroxymethylpyrimidine/phosphomethylpyrimidine kinase [Planctomycetota bacterium]
MKRILVVAGHDPSYRGGWRGGAGVDADREAAAHFGVEAECVVSAWTDQDGERVRSVEPRATTDWLEEARYALALPIGALKSGLLPSAAAVRALAGLIDEITRARAVPVVVDPVLSASGGEVLLDDEGIEALLAELLPRDVILTPNVPEAARLAGLELERLAFHRAERVRAAEILLERGARAVVLKGGHSGDVPVADLVLQRGAAPVWLEHRRLFGARLHGSGCRFGTALAAQLANGIALERAVSAAGAWLVELLGASPES